MLSNIVKEINLVLDVVKKEVDSRTVGNPDYLYDNERHELVNLYHAVEQAKDIYERQSIDSCMIG
jgi:hypothetical protein